MAHILLSDLTAAIKEKLDARAKRVGIPERAYCLKETEPDRLASLFISGNEGDGTAEILRLSCSPDGKCSVFVRETAFQNSGSPRDFSASASLPDEWHCFEYAQSNEDAARCISLYAPGILEYEFGLFETNAEPFECCSRQYTCSIRGECLHPDQLYAKACIYRKTLLTGNKY